MYSHVYWKEIFREAFLRIVSDDLQAGFCEYILEERFGSASRKSGSQYHRYLLFETRFLPGPRVILRIVFSGPHACCVLLDDDHALAWESERCLTFFKEGDELAV